MARLAVCSFVVIFILFSFAHAHARFISTLPEQDRSTRESITEFPESNPKTIKSFLPPSKEFNSEPVDSKVDDAVEAKSDVDFDPMTIIRLRPMTRHFPWRPFIPFRHKHDCRFRFRFHRQFKPSNQRPMQNINIPYGNDMILSNHRDRFDPESRGVARQIHPRWITFPHDTDRSKEVADFIKLHHHDHDHEREHGHHHEEDRHHHHHHHRHHHHEEEEEHEHKGGFMKKLRKFLLINF